MQSPIPSYLETVGKTQRQFAAELNVREATVSAWARGKRPRPDQMERIAIHTNGAIPITAWFPTAGAA